LHCQLGDEVCTENLLKNKVQDMLRRASLCQILY
jgi:hypothetical protein